MNKYSKKFITGWSIGFTFLLLFNLLMFFAPAISDAIFDWIGTLGTGAIVAWMLFWPLFLANIGLAVYGMIIAIIVDIVVLLIFYSAQKKRA